MADSQTTATKNVGFKDVLSGAFGGEMKYFIILFFAAGGVMLTGFVTTFLFLNQSLVQIQAGLSGSLAAGFVVFFICWILIYYRKTLYSGKYKQLSLLIRPYNYIWDVFVANDAGHAEEQKNGVSTGWASKTFHLDKPTQLVTEKHNYGAVPKVIIQYYGSWSKNSSYQPSDIVYDGMVVPHSTTEFLVVEEIQNAFVDMNYDVKTPIFRLINGRCTSQNYTTLSLQNITSNLTAETANQPTELSALQQENNDLKSAIQEFKRQSQADKTEKYNSQYLTQLNISEKEALKTAVDNQNQSIVDIIMSHFSLDRDWGKTFARVQKERGSKMTNFMPFILIIAAVAIVTLFLYSPIGESIAGILNQMVINPIIAVAIIAIAAATGAFIVYMIRRRNKP